jgi:hypothetical protein
LAGAGFGGRAEGFKGKKEGKHGIVEGLEEKAADLREEIWVIG